MRIKISSQAWLVLVATLALFGVWWATDHALAQGPSDRAPSAVLSTETYTYQGRLTSSGAPANGLYDFRVSVYDSELGGTLIGGVNLFNDLTVTDGVFTLNIPPGASGSIFNGNPRWLLVEVRPGASVGAYTALPRQPITSVPYAWGLRPGAVISGTSTAADSWILKVNASGTTYPTASAIQGTSATGYAVNGISPGGWGVYARTDDGTAVFGLDMGSTQARGYGGFFESMNGIGVYGESLATRTWNNVHAPGVYGKSSNGAGVLGLSTGSSGHAGHFANVDIGAASGQVGVWAATYWGNIYEGWEIATWDTTGTYGGFLRFRVSYGGNVYADGSYNCGLGASCFNTGIGADVAERIDVRQPLMPGDVVEIDPENSGQFRLSHGAYSTLVAGVVSTNPAITMNNNDLADNDTDVRTDNRPLLALVGQVPVKVSAENGAIQPGDLLVASSTPGHAMKAGANPPAGTIIGKALGTLEQGTGTLTMLVMLR
ncbi:MAG: hypothetical protein HZB51_22435 [Chloroflexi bacterium]|nr:hypothetical protein [Chloroflexota bacterium]